MKLFFIHLFRLTNIVMSYVWWWSSINNRFIKLEKSAKSLPFVSETFTMDHRFAFSSATKGRKHTNHTSGINLGFDYKDFSWGFLYVINNYWKVRRQCIIVSQCEGGQFSPKFQSSSSIFYDIKIQIFPLHPNPHSTHNQFIRSRHSFRHNRSMASDGRLKLFFFIKSFFCAGAKKNDKSQFIPRVWHCNKTLTYEQQRGKNSDEFWFCCRIVDTWLHVMKWAST